MLLRLLFITLPLLLSAQTLKELLYLAQKNETVLAQKALYESAKEQRVATKRLYLPTIDIGSSYTMLENESMGNPQSSAKIYAKASALLYDGGKREALFRAHLHNELIGKETLEEVINTINLKTATAYFHERNINAAKGATAKKIEQLRAELTRLEKFQAVGSASLDEVERIRASVFEAEATLASLELEHQKAHLNLEWLCGEEVSISRDSKIVAPEFEGENPSGRASILSLKEQTNLAKEQIAIKESELLPTFVIEDTISHSRYDFEENSFDINAPEDQNMLFIGVRWKIFDFGAGKRESEAKRLEHQAAIYKLKNEERLAHIELKNAKKSLRISEKILKAAEARVRSSTYTYDAIKKKFQAGIVNNVEYLDALANRYDAESELERAKNNLEIKKAEYYYYAGKKLEEFIR